MSKPPEAIIRTDKAIGSEPDVLIRVTGVRAWFYISYGSLISDYWDRVANPRKTLPPWKGVSFKLYPPNQR